MFDTNLTHVDITVAVLGLAACITGVVWWLIKDYQDDNPDAPC